MVLEGGLLVGFLLASWRLALVGVLLMFWMIGLVRRSLLLEFVLGLSLLALAVWTDGSLVRDGVTGICCGGAGVFAMAYGACWTHRSWCIWTC